MMDSGRLTEPHDCEAAPHVWWYRARAPRVPTVYRRAPVPSGRGRLRRSGPPRPGTDRPAGHGKADARDEWTIKRRDGHLWPPIVAHANIPLSLMSIAGSVCLDNDCVPSVTSGLDLAFLVKEC
jgi:hypothetical protein